MSILEKTGFVKRSENPYTGRQLNIEKDVKEFIPNFHENKSFDFLDFGVEIMFDASCDSPGETIEVFWIF